MNQPALSECQKTSQVYRSKSEEIKQQMQELCHNDFKAMINRYISALTQQLSQASWFDAQMPAAQFLMPDLASYAIAGQHDSSSHFTPFIQKLVVKPDSKVIVIGDLHGDLDALLAILQELEQTGYLDDQFRFIRDDVYFVFLGDYINRGVNSIGVVYLLCKLFVTNPGRVVMLRGNHEYALTSKNFQKRFFQAQADGQDYPAQKTFLCELEQRFSDYKYPDLLYWFDYLPLALYLGTPDQSGRINFVKLCHAGLEVGYNPQSFLSSSSSFCLLTTFDRYAGLESLKQQLVDSSFIGDVQKAFDYCASQEATGFEKHFQVAEPVNLASDISAYQMRIGMQWNNFLTDDQGQPEFAFSAGRRRLYLGKRATQNLLKQRSNDLVAVHAIMRGHQHLDEKIDALQVDSPMLSLIRKQAGVVRQWDGAVYTLGASDHITGYHSFVMLHVKSDLSKWNARHYFKKPQADNFCMRAYPFLG
ncbi:serine/threonine protein phosphatase [Candidatus Dependentiae bacterium]|nr:serine/threonine protein phosphatase [Candidatus Dependentiae bacterium]